MTRAHIADIFADPKRFAVLTMMRHRDLTAHDIATALGLPPSAASYQIKQMVAAGLLRGTRSDVDARVVYYRLEMTVVTRYMDEVKRAFGMAVATVPNASVVLLYVCRANSARSQMAEAWSRVLLPQQVHVASCGIEVRPIHPLTIATMAEVGVDLSTAQPTQLSAVTVRPTVVVSVCDSARTVAAQSYLHAEHLHWSIPDPATRAEIGFFRQARDAIRERVVDLSARYATQ